MFTIIGIDWGEKRPGIAFADPIYGLIIPYKQKVENQNLIEIVLAEIETRKITKIVIGKPLNSKGQDTQVTQNINNFKLELESKLPKEKEIQIFFQDERWTSKEGQKFGFSKNNLNHFSAIRILERYLKANLTEQLS